MTLQEAVYKMSPGDTFKPIKEGLSVMKMQKSGFLLNDKGNNLIMSADAMEIEGQIMPAEPKVLTAEEMYNKELKFHTCSTVNTLRHGEAMDKNGQLKQWLGHKELRETVEEFSNFEPEFLCPSIVCEYQGRLKTLLYKLKAPND